ncbi:hypothetical protein WS91_06545 [Burkholderia sp. MSMB1498]|nr:hypothetical protein WS91_06545 [Burkholderia sp. MSMB1498]
MTRPRAAYIARRAMRRTRSREAKPRGRARRPTRHARRAFAGATQRNATQRNATRHDPTRIATRTPHNAKSRGAPARALDRSNTRPALLRSAFHP